MHRTHQQREYVLELAAIDDVQPAIAWRLATGIANAVGDLGKRDVRTVADAPA